MADDKQTEELWNMFRILSQHVDDLKELLVAERARNKSLDAENSGWLAVYQKFLSRIGVLEAELSRLQPRT
jgi:hypothetical protein